ncbi:MAG: hypothetical protein IPH04_14935 [Saprospirales bacterium]|nr:hypothetical protein [Saprospirales bacterium]
MTGMEIHDAIGDGMVIVLTPFAIAAALVAVFAVGVKVAAFVMYGSERKDLDVIGSHLVSADGKSWDFSKSQSDKARAQRDIRPANDDPEVWDGVEYDDDGRKYEIVPAQGETRPVRSDMDLEIVDAEIIPE